MAKPEWEVLAVSNLFDIADILAAHQVPFWLDYGTLLVAVRERSFMQWSEDIDLGMPDSAWNQLFDILEKISDLGFKCNVRVFKISESIFRVVKFWRHDFAVDISLYKKIGEDAIDLHTSFDPWMSQLRMARVSWFLYRELNLSRALRHRLAEKNRRMSILFRHLDILPEKSKLDLACSVRYVMGWHVYNYARIPFKFYAKTEEISFYGRQFPVPNRPHEYLRFLYGPGWQMRDPSYRERDADWSKYLISKDRTS
jgi:phosphorylcholine metabolism protein LicD